MLNYQLETFVFVKHIWTGLGETSLLVGGTFVSCEKTSTFSLLWFPLVVADAAVVIIRLQFSSTFVLEQSPFGLFEDIADFANFVSVQIYSIQIQVSK